MDYNTYRNQYFVNPPPEQRYAFTGNFGAALYYEDFQQAVDFYSLVLGPPAYAEGDGTRSWRIGDGWLTLLHGKHGNPRGVEIIFEMKSVLEAEKLHRDFIAAGGKGQNPTDEFMHVPVRFCPVTDPFGVDILVISVLPGEME